MRHSYSTLMAITNWRNLKRLTLSGLYKKGMIKNVQPPSASIKHSVL